jgi:antitoxin CptB
MTADSAETAEIRRKRLRMRSWRRGTREMDLLLGRYADARLATMDLAALDHFDALLAESDRDLMDWVLGHSPPPAGLAAEIARIAAFAVGHRDAVT